MKNIYFCSRTSHEVRGLKCNKLLATVTIVTSHLTRGAWIEIFTLLCGLLHTLSHLTRGAWIEIYHSGIVLPRPPGRTSHEVRGLKYFFYYISSDN